MRTVLSAAERAGEITQYGAVFRKIRSNGTSITELIPLYDAIAAALSRGRYRGNYGASTFVQCAVRTAPERAAAEIRKVSAPLPADILEITLFAGFQQPVVACCRSGRRDISRAFANVERTAADRAEERAAGEAEARSRAGLSVEVCKVALFTRLHDTITTM